MTEILIVEDNRINQIVASKILVGLGANVDLADNGIEGVAAVKAKKYDIVFMDCQMPEMDGYTAVAEIRKLEQAGEIFKVPVVALTAHTMPGDRQKCLDAGMDDYLSKPVSEQNFADTLRKWLGDYCDVAEHQLQAAYQFKYVSANDLEKLFEIMEEGFFGLMDMYFSSAKELLADLQKAIDIGDYPNIIRAAHTIKSPSRQIGSVDVAAKAGEIEALGRENGSLPEIAAKNAVLRELIIKANAELQQYVEQKK